METCICDISALKFWRTPPVVRLLVAAPEDSSLLAHRVDLNELAKFRSNLYTALPFCKAFASGKAWRHYGEHARTLRDQFMALAPSLDTPIDVLYDDPSTRSSSGLIQPRTWSGELPSGSIVSLTDEITVASPQFALQQFAARAPWARTYMLASELCGSFTIYNPPAPIKTYLQKLVDQNALPICNGWEPCLSNGRLTDLWKREPLLTPDDLTAFAQGCESTRGKAKILSVAKLLKPNAASPLEVQTGMMLGLPRRRGGEGLSGFEYNTKVLLSKDAQALAQKSYCLCDLLWEEQGLDVECQSMLAHNSWDSLVSDFDRAAALGQMGVRVIFATNSSVFDASRRDAFITAVANSLGKRVKPKSAVELKAQAALEKELMVDWNRLLVLKRPQ